MVNLKASCSVSVLAEQKDHFHSQYLLSSGCVFESSQAN